MKLICRDSVLDIDVLNDFKPDFEKAWFQVDVAKYGTDNILESEYGTFAKTSDNGIMYFRDLAFKMLADFCVRAKLGALPYIGEEFMRAYTHIDEPGDMQQGLMRPAESSALAAVLDKMGVGNILMPDARRTTKWNSEALLEEDVVNMATAGGKAYSSEYIASVVAALEIIDKYAYIMKSRRAKTFAVLHSVMTGILESLDLEDVKDFAENFYGALDNIPEMIYNENIAGTDIPDPVSVRNEEDINITADDLSERSTTDNADENGTEGMGYNRSEDMGHNDKNAARKLKMMSAADITGMDRTYTSNYCDMFYNNDLSKADSEGFLNQTIASRANGTAAPLDLLQETISKANMKGQQAARLRRSISELRQGAEEAADANYENNMGEAMDDGA